MLFFITLHSPAMSEERSLNPALHEEIESRTLRPFFNALKNGNVEVAKRYMTGTMYEEFRVALDVDAGYPDFLREHYKDAVFSVEGGIITDEQVIIDVGIKFPVIGKQVTQFYLQKQDSGQENSNSEQAAGEMHWRISEQRHNQAH